MGSSHTPRGNLEPRRWHESPSARFRAHVNIISKTTFDSPGENLLNQKPFYFVRFLPIFWRLNPPPCSDISQKQCRMIDKTSGLPPKSSETIAKDLLLAYLRKKHCRNEPCMGKATNYPSLGWSSSGEVCRARLDHRCTLARFCIS